LLAGCTGLEDFLSLKIERTVAIKAAQAAVAASAQRVFTIPEVADILKVSRKTIFNAVKAGKIRTIKVLGCTRISAMELRLLANAGTMATLEQIEEYYRDYANPGIAQLLRQDATHEGTDGDTN
jgi:excisionase family DNA binding protein